MTFKKLIEDDKNRLIFTSIWAEYKAGNQSKISVQNQLNKLFDLNWTFATYSRYLNVLEICQNIYEKDNLQKDIDKVITSHKVVSNNKKIRHLARQNILNDEIKNYFKEQKPKQIKIHPNYRTNIPKSNKPVDVFIADFHWTDSVNDYIVLDKIRDNLMKFRNKKLNIYLMGDLVQGVLRIDDLYAGSIDPVKQALNFSEAFCNMISDFTIEQISILKGNHDELRLLNHKGIDNPHISEIAKTYIKSKLDVKCEVFDEIETDNAIILHGHQFRGKRAIEREFKGKDKLLIHAHYHHFYVDENIIGLPAICSRSSYERSLGMSSKKGFFIMENNKMEVVYV